MFGARDSTALKVMISATLVYDVISATNSSPQTTEINAASRADTLMKWVHLGLVQAGAFALIGVVIDDEKWPIALGAGLAGAILYWQYVYAKNSGLASNKPGTESVLPAQVTKISPIYRGEALVSGTVPYRQGERP